MDKFVEICQEATQCMRYPQEDSFGWFLWIVWGIIIVTIVSGLIGNWQIRRYVWDSLKNPTEYRGRMGRDEFSAVYFGLQILRGCAVLACLILCAIFGKSMVTAVIILIGIILLGWFTAALYSAIIRRGHDFAFDGKEALLAYICSWGRHSMFEDQQHTWSVMCNNKGNPYANRFGSAPEENNYLIPQEQDWRSAGREFPNVWDEADWKNMKRAQRNPYKRTYWKREDK